ncbi:MAG: NUDIX domain-containing protein [Solirubrobacteraceae bacterium]
MPALPIALRRFAYRNGHRALRVWWHISTPTANGVKCVVRDGADIVFVRHTYGDRDAWELPGGGVKRGEDPRAAAAREAREELGVDVEPDAWQALGAFVAYGYGRAVTISCFEVWPGTRALTLDSAEIAEARWAPSATPPPPSGQDVDAVLRRVDPAA